VGEQKKLAWLPPKCMEIATWRRRPAPVGVAGPELGSFIRGRSRLHKVGAYTTPLRQHASAGLSMHLPCARMSAPEFHLPGRPAATRRRKNEGRVASRGAENGSRKEHKTRRMYMHKNATCYFCFMVAWLEFLDFSFHVSRFLFLSFSQNIIWGSKKTCLFAPKVHGNRHVAPKTGAGRGGRPRTGKFHPGALMLAQGRRIHNPS